MRGFCGDECKDRTTRLLGADTVEEFQEVYDTLLRRLDINNIKALRRVMLAAAHSSYKKAFDRELARQALYLKDVYMPTFMNKYDCTVIMTPMLTADLAEAIETSNLAAQSDHFANMLTGQFKPSCRR